MCKATILYFIWIYLFQGTSPDEMDKVFSVLSQLHTPDAGEEDISDQDQVGAEVKLHMHQAIIVSTWT